MQVRRDSVAVAFTCRARSLSLYSIAEINLGVSDMISNSKQHCPVGPSVNYQIHSIS